MELDAAVPADYPHYRIVRDHSLEQGDIFPGFGIIVPSLTEQDAKAQTEEDSLLVDVVEFNVIVLSQSCDLENDKIENVIVCPIFELAELTGRFPGYNKKNLKRGHYPGVYILPPCEIARHVQLARIVSFRQAWTTPFSQVRKAALTTDDRVRLQPPYREHLAQAFGRFVMRIGLPREFDLD
jgi:hypothetical protein